MKIKHTFYEAVGTFKVNMRSVKIHFLLHAPLRHRKHKLNLPHTVVVTSM